MDVAGAANAMSFDDEEVEGKVHEISAETEEDMIVYACYIAECITFKRQIDINTKGVKFLRSKIVDALLSLSYI